MSYEVFKRRVNALIRKSGVTCNPSFEQNEDKGNFVCYLNDSNNTRIIGNQSALKVTIRWGFDESKPSNYAHQSVVAI